MTTPTTELQAFLRRVADLGDGGWTEDQSWQVIGFFQVWRGLPLTLQLDDATMDALGVEGSDSAGSSSAAALYGTAKTQITSPFGPRGSGHHNGVDFAGAHLSKLYSVVDGKVLRAGGNYTSNGDCVVGDADCGGKWGNFVEIQMNDGNTVLYAHCAEGSIGVKPGQKVAKSCYLAKQGNTGSSRGDHLHFEYRKGGRCVDPIGKIVDEQGRAI